MAKSLKIQIAGYGFVGKVHALSLDDTKTSVTIYDPALGFETWQEDADCYIIAVSTPQGEDGSCDMSNVYNILEKCPNVPILIKSTISLEGWDLINREFPDHKITFSPEYLRAEHALEDFKKQTEMFFGGGDEYFWIDIFNPCKKFTPIFSSIPELILMKYVRNSFLATKVAFFNEIYDLCSKMNLQYDEVSYLVGMDVMMAKIVIIINRNKIYFLLSSVYMDIFFLIMV